MPVNLVSNQWFQLQHNLSPKSCTKAFLHYKNL